MTVLPRAAKPIRAGGRRLPARLCALALVATLAGCAAGNTASSIAATSSPPPAAPAAAAAQETKPAPQRLSSTEINEQCWMDPAINKVPDLDKRAKLVDKCVEQKIKAQGGL